MNLVGTIIDLEEICFCSFSVDGELYKFFYNYECGYIDRMEDLFTVKLDKSKAEVVYKYLKKQDI